MCCGSFDVHRIEQSNWHKTHHDNENVIKCQTIPAVFTILSGQQMTTTNVYATTGNNIGGINERSRAIKRVPINNLIHSSVVAMSAISAEAIRSKLFARLAKVTAEK